VFVVFDVRIKCTFTAPTLIFIIRCNNYSVTSEPKFTAKSNYLAKKLQFIPSSERRHQKCKYQ